MVAVSMLDRKCIGLFWLGERYYTQHYVVNVANVSSLCCYCMYKPDTNKFSNVAVYMQANVYTTFT